MAATQLIRYIGCDHDSSIMCTTSPVQNPQDFPVQRIQEVQAQYYPSTTVVQMLVHRNEVDEVVQVTADMADGRVDHLVIIDKRLIQALGFDQDNNDIITIKEKHLYLEETFTIRVLPGQDPNDHQALLVGELMAATHPYLYWLGLRRTADPQHPPMIEEARLLANDLRRRMPQVWRELRNAWDREHGENGQWDRANRETHYGYDPVFPEATDGYGRLSTWT